MQRTENDTAIVICKEDGTTLDLDEYLLEHGVQKTMELLGIGYNPKLEATLVRYLETIRDVMKSETRLMACEREVEEQIAKLSEEQFEELLSRLDFNEQNELTKVYKITHPDEDDLDDPLDGFDGFDDFHVLH
ncbi:hypothetical protein IM774_00095 [Erysipelotrichaceae bacterium RD49]|nr:hypothetical protein [Erysipelotrichaceae bacterium RD49]